MIYRARYSTNLCHNSESLFTYNIEMYATYQRLQLLLSLWDGVVLGFYNAQMTFKFNMNDDHCPCFTHS